MLEWIHHLSRLISRITLSVVLFHNHHHHALSHTIHPLIRLLLRRVHPPVKPFFLFTCPLDKSSRGFVPLPNPYPNVSAAADLYATS